VARFPENVAVLTTGAPSLQTVGSRAIVLGPYDISQRTAAHEFGHLLGLPDSYLRGYRDLGLDGFEILELVPDRTDIMSSIEAGYVQTRHFEDLVAAKKVQRAMLAGLAALYQRGDPDAAVAQFRAILAVVPTHYGATLQLAKALDRAGVHEEALVWWRKILALAERAGDDQTGRAAKARLSGTSIGTGDVR